MGTLACLEGEDLEGSEVSGEAYRDAGPLAIDNSHNVLQAFRRTVDAYSIEATFVLAARVA